MRKIEVKPGDRYGRLTIVEETESRVEPSGRKKRQVICNCDCGKKGLVLSLDGLRTGNTKSCGCYRKESIKKTKKKFNEYVFNNDGSVTGYTLKGERFLFDEEYYEEFKQYCWRKELGYVLTTDGETGKDLRMHRMVTKCPDNKIVDHINRDKSDNRKQNLRICTYADNNKNLSISKRNSSGVTGVVWYKSIKKWRSVIMVDGERIHLGYFTSKQEAIEARLKAELEYHGIFSPNYQKLTQQNTQSQQNT